MDGSTHPSPTFSNLGVDVSESLANSLGARTCAHLLPDHFGDRAAPADWAATMTLTTAQDRCLSARATTPQVNAGAHPVPAVTMVFLVARRAEVVLGRPLLSTTAGSQDSNLTTGVGLFGRETAAANQAWLLRSSG